MNSLERLRAALADRYTLERELGAGGMATVYLAQDLKHDRKVALKVLKPELAAVLGAERFVVEIKTTAALQHPHILPLFDSGEAGGFLYYVMPFIDGETLRAKLDRETQLGIDEAVRITTAVADALDYAHRHGVIHRDIKPENILLHEGRPMVADFGIALAVSAAAGGRMTETGLSLGTPHYMSPEQATAEKEITARSDIYSLGSVLYEMLTGSPPHVGASAQQIIMKIVTEEAAPVTRLRKSVPPHVADAVAQALEKLPADRFATAKEFADALAGEGTAVSPRRTRLQAAAARPPTRLAALPVLTTVTVLAALAAWGWLRPRTLPPPPPETRFVIEHSEAGAFGDAAGSPLAFSPDGSQLVYIGRDAEGRQHLFRRGLDNPEPALLPGTEDAVGPFFSPDGLVVGFAQDGRLRTKALAGGPVATLSENGSPHASWGPDGHIWVGRTNALERIPARGGAAGETVFQLDSAGGQLLRWPDALPNGRGVLLTLIEGLEPRLAVVTLPGRTLKLLGPAGMYPRWVEKGYLVWVDLDGTLLAARFDDRALVMTGPPQPIASGVRYGPAFPGKLAVSRSGALAYYGGTGTSRELVLVDPVAGREVVLQRGAFYATPRFSPDGRRLAFNIYDFAGRTLSDVWTYDFASGSVSRESFDARSFSPEWLADSRRILVAGLDFRRILTADGSGRTDTLRRDWGDGDIDEVHLLPDGQRAVYRRRLGGDWDIFAISLASDAEPEPLQATRFNEASLALSPDGRWLAYVSDESGTQAVYLRAVSGGGGRVRVSPGMGREPRWGPGGRTLYYRSADSVLVVAVTPGEVSSTGAPRLAWTGTYVTNANLPTWDVSPDGGRFVFTRTEEGSNRRLNVVLHWFDNDARRDP